MNVLQCHIPIQLLVHNGVHVCIADRHDLSCNLQRIFLFLQIKKLQEDMDYYIECYKVMNLT